MNLLILSIGSNPMPNYITAKYLLHENRKELECKNLPKPDMVMFVYSSRTEKFKEKIAAQLDLNQDQSLGVNLENKFREFEEIKQKVLEKLKELKPYSIHLNYTGGTKPMAVGISSAVEQFEECKNKIYSDLSPDKFKLILRKGNVFPINRDIRDIVKISIKDLYELHDLKTPTLKKENSNWYSEKFINYLIDKKNEFKKGDEDFYYLWRKWPGKTKDKDNRKALKISSGGQNNELEGYKQSLELSVKDFIKDQTLDSQQLKHLKKFICGVWLEEYLFAVLQEIKEDCGLTDIAWNVETKIKGRRFELDIIAMKGCQSFVFTCTSDHTSSLCKGKAFEGVYRSEQIGGEQSKTILVCMGDDFDKKGKPTDDNDKKVIESIKKDMSQFDAVSNFYILGSEDIKNSSTLKTKLKQIINGDI